MRKTYISKHFLKLTLFVRINGRSRSVDFTGGYEHPRKVTGSYSTVDPIMQEALEAHPGFGESFVLSKTTETAKIEAPVKEAKHYSEAKNGLEAKNELNKKYGVPWSMLKNNTMVRSVASEYGVEYPHWK